MGFRQIGVLEVQQPGPLPLLPPTLRGEQGGLQGLEFRVLIVQALCIMAACTPTRGAALGLCLCYHPP